MRSAKSHTICDVLAVGEGTKNPSYPVVLMIQCKTSGTDLIPNLKQLLQRTDYDFQQKSNLQLLEEKINPLHNLHKLLLWKGKGKLNMYVYSYIGNHKWVGRKIKSIEEYIIQII